MNSLHNFLKTASKEDWDRISSRIVAQFREKEKLRREFYTSEKCEHIIQRILATNQGIESDDPFYHAEEIIKTFGFEDVSLDDFNFFFNVMCDPHIGAEDITDSAEDKDNPFPNFHHNKRGLSVYVMIGQGTSIFVSPIKKA